MADNTQLNVGSGGDLIATDDVGGVKFQRVKLVDGTSDSADAIAGDSTYGLDVDVTRLPSLSAGSQLIGKVDVNSDPSQAVNGGALPSVQTVIAGFDGVNVKVAKTDAAGVLQMQPVSTVTVAGTVGLSSAGDQAATLANGRVTVPTPGTAVALAGSAACAWVSVSALPSNTGLVCVGGAGVLATAGSETGVVLWPGGSVTVPTTNVANVYVDALVAGEGVSFLRGV